MQFYEQIYYESFAVNYGPHLLGGLRSFAPALDGTVSISYSDSTLVPARVFRGRSRGLLRYLLADFRDEHGTTYMYSVTFDEGGCPRSGLLVTITTSAVPELSTWTMLLAGLAFVGSRARVRAGVDARLN